MNELDEFLRDVAADCVEGVTRPRRTPYGVLRRAAATPQAEAERGPYLRDAHRWECLVGISRHCEPMVAPVAGEIELVTLDLDHATFDLVREARRTHLACLIPERLGGRHQRWRATMRTLRRYLAAPDEPMLRAEAAAAVLDVEHAAAQLALDY